MWAAWENLIYYASFFFSFERDEDGNDAKGNLINYNLG